MSRRSLKKENPAQPGGKAELATNRCANTTRGPGRLHRSPDMAVANYFVQLQVGHLEEALGFTVGIVFQPFGARASYRGLRRADIRFP